MIQSVHLIWQLEMRADPKYSRMLSGVYFWSQRIVQVIWTVSSFTTNIALNSLTWKSTALADARSVFDSWRSCVKLQMVCKLYCWIRLQYPESRNFKILLTVYEIRNAKSTWEISHKTTHIITFLWRNSVTSRFHLSTATELELCKFVKTAITHRTINQNFTITTIMVGYLKKNSL